MIKRLDFIKNNVIICVGNIKFWAKSERKFTLFYRLNASVEWNR